MPFFASKGCAELSSSKMSRKKIDNAAPDLVNKDKARQGTWVGAGRVGGSDGNGGGGWRCGHYTRHQIRKTKGRQKLFYSSAQFFDSTTLIDAETCRKIDEIILSKTAAVHRGIGLSMSIFASAQLRYPWSSNFAAK